MESETPSPDGESETFEKWLVRIFLVLAFGVAFGIEGMTLIRGYLLDEEETERVQEAENGAEDEPLLREGQPFFSDRSFSARLARTSLTAQPDAWRFAVVVRVRNPTDRPVTLSFRRLETKNGRTLEPPVSNTWAPGDSSAFTAHWDLEPGDQPVAVTVAFDTEDEDDVQRFRIGRVPVQMQR